MSSIGFPVRCAVCDAKFRVRARRPDNDRCEPCRRVRTNARNAAYRQRRKVRDPKGWAAAEANRKRRRREADPELFRMMKNADERRRRYRRRLERLGVNIAALPLAEPPSVQQGVT